jgi:tetratricopeptide (TPR) repeat protein
MKNDSKSSAHARASSKRRPFKLAVIAVFAAACAISILKNSPLAEVNAAGGQAPATGQKSETASERHARERFDYLVRADFFAGFAGDQAAFDRAMRLCEQTLAKNQKHAEAMVWHGSGLLFTSSQYFQKGDSKKGMDLWTRGLKEMDAAVALEPDNVGVLIPRGATLIPASRFVPSPEQSKALLQKGVNDYEKVLEIQKAYFANLSGHGRGELLFGLAEGWLRLGNAEKARAYFQRIADEAQGSERQKQAKIFLETGTIPQSAQTCTGCHTK